MSMTNRVLVIEKLVFNIPDDYVSKTGNDEVSIDEALELLLQYRQKATAVIENKVGNFVYFSADYPDEVSPLDVDSFNKDNLLAFLHDHPEKAFAGLMATLLFDEDLYAYRNCYRGQEQDEFLRRKEEYLDSIRKAHEATEHIEKEDAEESSSENTGDAKDEFYHMHIGDIPEPDTTTESAGSEEGYVMEVPDDPDAGTLCEDCDEICDEACPEDNE